MKRKILIVLSLAIHLVISAQTDTLCATIKQEIISTRALMDSIRFNQDILFERNQLDSLNKILDGHIDVLAKNNLFQHCDINLKYNFYYLLSSDKKFAICSWDTQQGGSLIDFTNTVIYKQKSETKVEKLYYGEKENIENTKIMFDSIITLSTNKGDTIYLAHGSGRFGSMLPFKVLRGFKIEEGLVQDFELFPPEESANYGEQYPRSSLWIVYDRQEFKAKDAVKDFVYVDNAYKILIPIIDNRGRPTEQYYTLFFDGTKYIK